jgi:hypothetical protein
MKLRNRILAGVSVLAIAGTAAIAGVTSASASPAAPSGSSGFEFFSLITTSGNSPSSSIIATGVFTAGGTITDTSNTTATVTFPNGTFVITHSKGTGTPRINGATCLFALAENGTYQVGDGTGAYAGISGHGIYRLNITAVAARNSAGKCSNRFAAYQQIIKAQGPLSL